MQTHVKISNPAGVSWRTAIIGKKVITFPLSCSQCLIIHKNRSYLTTMQLFKYFSLFMFYLRNCSIVVQPLAPWCPSSYFPPLLRTGLRPFLLLYRLLPKRFSCVFVWRKLSQNAGRDGTDIITIFSLFWRRLSPTPQLQGRSLTERPQLSGTELHSGSEIATFDVRQQPWF